MRDEDIAYYSKRAREERERATCCEDNTVALAHLRMADEYERLLAGEPRESFLTRNRGDTAPQTV